jgi:hypothetical protein
VRVGADFWEHGVTHSWAIPHVHTMFRGHGKEESMSENSQHRGSEQYTVHPFFPWAVMSDLDYAMMAGFPHLLDGRWLTPAERARGRYRDCDEAALMEPDLEAPAAPGESGHSRGSYTEAVNSVSRYSMQVCATLCSGIRRAVEPLYRAPIRLTGGLIRIARTASAEHGRGIGSH